MKTLQSHIEAQKTRFLDELFELIRIPSVSAKSDHKPFMLQAAEYVKKVLLEAGAGRAEVIPTEGHPIVYAEKILDQALPTILVYGHYDVQPPEPLELWKTPPFEPVIVDGKIFARGADDDKGQLFMQIKAFEILNRENLLAVNVKFVIEGEEEIGSEHLKSFCQDRRELLRSDLVLVSDSTMVAPDIPSVTVGVRGLAYFQVEVTGPNRDLHSGIYGGAVTNPVNALARLIARLTDSDNRIAIPGFYDDVVELTAEERRALNSVPFDEAGYRRTLDIDTVNGETGYTTMERTGIRPSVDVNGIWGGYSGEGAKTVLPSKAFAKISFRLVPNQEPLKVERLFEAYFRKIAPPGVRVSVRLLHSGRPYTTSTGSAAYANAEQAYLAVFGKKPVPVRSGGSIPVVADFEEVLGVKSLLLGFGLESDAIHSPNENFPVFNFLKGIETICSFYLDFQKQNSSR